MEKEYLTHTSRFLFLSMKTLWLDSNAIVICSQFSSKPRLSFGMKFLCSTSMILMLLINVWDLLEVSNHLHLITLELTYYLEWPSIWWNYSGIWRGFLSDFACGTKGVHQQVVAASLCKGNLWGHIKFLHLRQNMCLGHSEADNQHAQ